MHGSRRFQSSAASGRSFHAFAQDLKKTSPIRLPSPIAEIRTIHTSVDGKGAEEKERRKANPNSDSAKPTAASEPNESKNSTSTNSKPTKEPEEKAKGGLAELKRILSLARPESLMISGAVALLFISSGVTMSVPYWMGKLIDLISTPGINLPEAMAELYPYIAAIFVTGAVANAGRVFLISYSGAKLVARLRSSLYSNLLSRPLSFLDKQRTGELISRLSTDVQIMSRVVTQTLSDGLRSIVTTLVGGGMLFAISPKLTGVMMAILPFLAIAARLYGRFVRSLSKKTQEALAHAVEEAEEKLANIRTVRSFGRERLEVTRFEGRIAEILRLAKVETIASAGFFSSAGLSGNLTILAVLFFGSNMVHTGAISVGELTSFLMVRTNHRKRTFIPN